MPGSREPLPPLPPFLRFPLLPLPSLPSFPLPVVEATWTLTWCWINHRSCYQELLPASILIIFLFLGSRFFVSQRNPWPIRCAKAKSSLPSAMAGAWQGSGQRVFFLLRWLQWLQNPVLCWSKAKLLQRFLLPKQIYIYIYIIYRYVIYVFFFHSAGGSRMLFLLED